MSKSDPSIGCISQMWAERYGVEFIGTRVSTSSGSKGFGLFASKAFYGPGSILLRVPKDLILSLDNVWLSAKSDHHLQEILDVCGEFARTPRGAILIFLFLQKLRLIVPKALPKIGIDSTLTHYIASLPSTISLPTRWSLDEPAMLDGTSLKAAVSAKLRSLRREFDHVYTSTKGFEWFHSEDNNVDTHIFFETWLEVDAMYRSRALDLPGTGHGMVPCVDLANHATGYKTVALYETNCEGDAVLILGEDKVLKEGEEVTITYGDQKGACEMLFSYGFIDESMASAQELFLDLDIPEDDPLRPAKLAFSDSPPGVRLFLIDNQLKWESTFIWLICVNEEDGLGFQVAQQESGHGELLVSWKEAVICDAATLKDIIHCEPNWDLFDLRAQVTIQDRVEKQLRAICGSKNLFTDQDPDAFSHEIVNILKLRDLEENLLLKTLEFLDLERSRLLSSEVIKNYFARGFDTAQDP